MKKISSIFFAIVMVFTMVTTAFAAPGAFISSPSKNDNPVLVEWGNESDGCAAGVKITAYKDRDEASEYIRNMLEKAYKIITECDDLTTLCKDFADYAEKLGLTGKDLAVSDLFDLSYGGCDAHDEHGKFTIKLTAKTLDNFVGLLHYNDGEWEFIENAKVLEDGETLEFVIDDFSPFAVVVNAGDAPVSTDAEPSINYIPLIIIACCVVLFIIIVVVKRKKKDEK